GCAEPDRHHQHARRPADRHLRRHPGRDRGKARVRGQRVAPSWRPVPRHGQAHLRERDRHLRRHRPRALPGFGHAPGRVNRRGQPEQRHPPAQRRQLPAGLAPRQRRRRPQHHARAARLAVRLPLLAAPWFPFPVDDRRRTGLLYPAVGSSSRNGFDYRQPIYLNLAPNYDATLTPRLMTERGVQLGTQFRYLVEGGAGTLEFDYLPSDRLASRERDEETAEFIEKGYPLENRRDDDRGQFSFRGHQRLSGSWIARGNLNWISDPRYLEDFSNN